MYVEMHTGNAFWVLPKKYKLKDVKYLSHLTEDGSSYYEELATNQTSWTLPAVMSAQAKSNTAAYQLMTRDEAEVALVEAFPEEESAEQMAKIDAYFDPNAERKEDESEEEEEEEEDDDEGAAQAAPQRPTLSRQATSGIDGEHSSDEEDAVNALASINKMGRRSTVGRDSEVGIDQADLPPASGGASRPASQALSVPVVRRTMESVRITTTKVRCEPAP